MEVVAGQPHLEAEVKQHSARFRLDYSQVCPALCTVAASDTHLYYCIILLTIFISHISHSTQYYMYQADLDSLLVATNCIAAFAACFYDPRALPSSPPGFSASQQAQLT